MVAHLALARAELARVGDLDDVGVRMDNIELTVAQRPLLNEWNNLATEMTSKWFHGCRISVKGRWVAVEECGEWKWMTGGYERWSEEPDSGRLCGCINYCEI
jgi:hypothetical protein